MLSKFNCNTLGWMEYCSFFPIYYIQLTIVPSNRSPVCLLCLYVLEPDAWPHFLLYEESPKWRTELTLIAIMLFVCTCRDLKMSSSYKNIQVSLLYNRYPCIAKKLCFVALSSPPTFFHTGTSLYDFKLAVMTTPGPRQWILVGTRYLWLTLLCERFRAG